MLTDNRAQYRPQEWFLIACDGDLVLKLAHDLRIGEDEAGQTLISPTRDEALLAITCADGSLTLRALAMNWTFSEAGGLSVQHLTFVEGLTLKLNFPNSSLVITPDFVAGRRVPIDREIELRPTQTPSVTLSRVDEPIVLIEPPLLPAPEASADELEAITTEVAADPGLEELSIDEVTAFLEAANEDTTDDAFLGWHHDVPDEIAPEEPLREEPLREEPLREETRSEAPLPGNTKPGSRKPAAAEAVSREDDVPLLTVPFVQKSPGDFESRASADAAEAERSPAIHRVTGGLIAAALLLAPMYFFVVDSRDLGIDFPLTSYRATSSPESADAWPEAVAETVPLPDVFETADSAVPSEIAPAIVPMMRRSNLSEEEQLLIASLLAEAKAYYAAGAIVTPVEANAVSNLTRVLHLDPTNPEGLKLMYESAVRLIDEAEAAHAAGNNYLARNLVEDVLGFHPEFQDARTLLDSWTRAPEG